MSTTVLGVHGNPHSASWSSVSWCVVNAGPPSDLAQLVAPHRQLARRGDGRVLLPERPGGGVAGVGRRPGWGLRPASRRSRFSSSWMACRSRTPPATCRPRPGPRAPTAPARQAAPWGCPRWSGDVGRDVLALLPVATGHALDQPATLVAQRDGQPVDLELSTSAATSAASASAGRGPSGPTRRTVLRRPAATSAAAVRAAQQPLAPGHQLLGGEGVVERHHGHPVDDLRERGRGRSTHLRGGRALHHQLGELLLQRPQLAHQVVVVRVRDGGRVLGVVAAVVLGDLRSELPCPGLHVVGGHREAHYRRRMTT